MQLERGRCCMLLSRCPSTISANITVHCKKLQEYVKSIIKDEKSVETQNNFAKRSSGF